LISNHKIRPNFYHFRILSDKEDFEPTKRRDLKKGKLIILGEASTDDFKS
jgi:hypothetical protein